MELETPPCFFKDMPADIMDHIASFLTFDDIESEEEFIERKKGISDYPESSIEKEYYKKRREIASSWLIKHQYITDAYHMYLCVYSPNNNLCAMTYVDGPPQRNMIIVDTNTTQELHNFCLIKNTTDESKEKYIQHLAISSNGNIFAIKYNKYIDGDIGFSSFIKIHNIRTQKKEHPAYPNDGVKTIAFNKQDTHLIIHGRHKSHKIIPLTTTLEERKLPQKTLSHYFAQKGICKKIQ